MIRTVFRVEPEEKDWLRRCARSERVPMAEVVRRAVRQYRVRRESPPAPDQLLLWRDPGLWAAADGGDPVAGGADSGGEKEAV